MSKSSLCEAAHISTEIEDSEREEEALEGKQNVYIYRVCVREKERQEDVDCDEVVD